MTNMEIINKLAANHDHYCKMAIAGNGKIIKEGEGWFRLQVWDERGFKTNLVYERSFDDGNIWLRDVIRG